MSGLFFVEAVTVVSSVGFVDGGEAVAKDREKRRACFPY